MVVIQWPSSCGGRTISWKNGKTCAFLLLPNDTITQPKLIVLSLRTSLGLLHPLGFTAPENDKWQFRDLEASGDLTPSFVWRGEEKEQENNLLFRQMNNELGRKTA